MIWEKDQLRERTSGETGFGNVNTIWSCLSRNGLKGTSRHCSWLDALATDLRPPEQPPAVIAHITLGPQSAMTLSVTMPPYSLETGVDYTHPQRIQSYYQQQHGLVACLSISFFRCLLFPCCSLYCNFLRKWMNYIARGRWGLQLPWILPARLTSCAWLHWSCWDLMLWTRTTWYAILGNGRGATI